MVLAKIASLLPGLPQVAGHAKHISVTLNKPYKKMEHAKTRSNLIVSVCKIRKMISQISTELLNAHLFKIVRISVLAIMKILDVPRKMKYVGSGELK